MTDTSLIINCPFWWGLEYTDCYLQRYKTPSPQKKCPGYDINDSETPVLEIWEMWNLHYSQIHSFPSWLK